MGAIVSLDDGDDDDDDDDDDVSFGSNPDRNPDPGYGLIRIAGSYRITVAFLLLLAFGTSQYKLFGSIRGSDLRSRLPTG